MTTRTFARLVTLLILACAAIAAQCQVNTWVFKAHMGSARGDFAAVTGSDNRIYALGGTLSSTGPGIIADCEVYDTSTDAWTSIAPMPDNRAFHAAVATPNGKIYVFGGFVSHGGSTNTTLVYNIATNGWSSCANIPVTMGSPVAALGDDGRIVVEQGPVFAGDSPVVYIYDPFTDVWTLPPTDPPSDFTNQSAALISPFGTDLFIAGDIVRAPETTFNVYDASTHVWSTGPDFPVPTANPAAAYGGDNRVYCMGGYDGTSILASGFAFSFAKGAWEAVPNMNIARKDFAAATGPDGNVYVMGGNITPSGQTNSVECFTPPVLRAIGYPINAQEGTAFSGAVVTFTDNPSDTVSDFSATIDWGDGTQTTGSIVNTGPGAFDVRGTHTYVEEGTYQTTVSLTDVDGESQSVLGTFYVSDAPLSGSAVSITPYRAIAFSGKVATFTDANPSAPLSDFSATINWGDGSGTSTGSITIDPSGGFDVSGGHTYSSTGTFSVSVKVTDVGGAMVAVTGLATVVEPPPLVSAGTVTTSEGALFNGQVATFTDADPNLGAGDFTATINWGDGVTSSGNIVSNGAGGFKVSGNHVYLEEGNLPVTVTVSVGGSTGSSSGVAAVADGILTATGYTLIEKGTTFSDTVATFTDADPGGVVGDFTAGIVWGDGKSSNGTIVAFGSGWKVVGSHSYLKRGKYTATIHIKDAGGATATATTLINVGPVK